MPQRKWCYAVSRRDSESDRTNYGDNNNIRCSIDDSIGNRDNCNQTNQDNINLLMLNVCGLTNKLKFDVFTEKITQYKIICLTEIKADEIDCISISRSSQMTMGISAIANHAKR